MLVFKKQRQEGFKRSISITNWMKSLERIFRPVIEPRQLERWFKKVERVHSDVMSFLAVWPEKPVSSSPVLIPIPVRQTPFKNKSHDAY